MKKRIISVICVILAGLLLCSCGEGGTELFGSRSAKIFIKLGDYKNSVIDKNSDDYKEYFDVLYFSDVASKNLYERSDEGRVQNGDYANIDYMGTINGAAFQGGTDTGHDLLIGSGSFIKGFEEGLIGVAVGETTVLHLKFPESYHSEDLAGKDADFEVKVNYRKVPVGIENAFKEMGFDSVEAYRKDIDERCIQNFAVRNFISGCTVKETPDKDMFTGVVMLALYDDYCRANMGKDIKTYLKDTGQDFNTFTNNLVTRMAEGQLDGLEEIRTIRNAVLAFYALYDEEGMTYDEKKLGNISGYERCFDEFMLIKEMTSDYLVKNAKVTERTDG